MNKNDNLKSQNKQNTVDTRRTKLDTSIDTNKIQDNKSRGPTGSIEQVVKKQEGPTGSTEQVLKKQEGPTGNISKPITTPINLNGPIRFVTQSNTTSSSTSYAKVNIQNRNNQKTFTIDEPITEDKPIIEETPKSIWEKLWSYFRK